MTDNNFEMLGREMEQVFPRGWGAAFLKNKKAEPAAEKSLEALLKEKIQDARTPAAMVRAVIEAVLAREFGPEISRTGYYADMVNSISSAMMANSEIKNRLIKMAVKYLDGGKIN